MHSLIGTPELFEVLDYKSRELTEKIFRNIKPLEENTLIPAGSSVYANEKNRGLLYIIKEGVVSYTSLERTLYFYDQGDLAGVENYCCHEFGNLITDFAVVADSYRYEDVFSQVSSDPELSKIWTDLLTTRLGMLNTILACSIKEAIDTDPDLLTYEEGDLVIEQGTMGTDVYTLVEGTMEVFVDGVSVGVILPDEIFGAMAALTETPRSATVVASELAMVLKLPKERFVDLMAARPHTVLKMVEDVSKKVISLNERVVELTKDQ